MKNPDRKKHYFPFCTALLFTAVLLVPHHAYGESLQSKIEKGDKLYKDELYDEAMKSFVDAQIESPEETKLKYNIANTHYKMNNYEEAIKNYQDVAATAHDIPLEEQSLYNIGNCLFRQGKLEESIEYYKKALELDPNDQEAKYNLEFVREEIKKRINQEKQRKQQQQKQEQQEQSQDQQNTEQQEDQKEQEQKSEDKQQKSPGEEQEQKQQQQEQQAGEKQEQPQPGGKEQKKAEPMTPEEAERWLRSLKEGKRKQMQPEERQATGSHRPEKDW